MSPGRRPAAATGSVLRKPAAEENQDICRCRGLRAGVSCDMLPRAGRLLGRADELCNKQDGGLL